MIYVKGRIGTGRDTYGYLAGVAGGDALGLAMLLQLLRVRDLVELRLQRRDELLILHVFAQQPPHLACKKGKERGVSDDDDDTEEERTHRRREW